MFGMILVMGLMEIVGVGSIMPFLSVLSNPEVVQENAYLSIVYEELGFTSTNSFLLFLGVGVFFLVTAGLVFKALTHYAMARFAHMRNYTLSTRLLQVYLSRPYSWFLGRHSADIGKTVLSEVQQVIMFALLPTVRLLAHSVVVLFLFALILFVDPFITLCAVVLFGGAYAGIYLGFRKYLARIGADRVRANQARFQIAQEALGGIKEVKAAGLESGYLQSFGKPARRFAKTLANNQVLTEVPRFLLEAIAVGGMLILILMLLALREGDFRQVLPAIGVFAFAGMRLLPALQKVYQSVSKLRFGRPALDVLHSDLIEMDDASAQKIKPRFDLRRIQPIGLKQQLELVNINFTYPGAKQAAIHDLNFRIAAKHTVGFVGPTGAGKTTVVDLIMGLLIPDSGEILVDDKQITGDNVRAWQRSIGYVPQQIFLADDTVAANIAFGVPPEEIDMAAVERCGRTAELHDFVISEMPYGYETMVGERGVRLSGGQRQRIGIARALYHDPDVLILDEATSALDNMTERAVMDAVHNLGHQKTIIIIAHRLTTVKPCDCIYFLEHGRLVMSGTYDQLFEQSADFQKLVASSG